MKNTTYTGKTYESKLIDGYLISSGLIYLDDLSKSTEDILILQLRLSVRSNNALLRAGLRNLSDILLLSEEELSKVKNLGAKSFEEVIHASNSHLKKTLGEKEQVNEPAVDEKRAEKPLEDMTINMLSLSNRAFNMMARCGYQYISEIADFTYDDFLKIKKLGVKTAQEIYDKVQAFLEEYREVTDTRENKSDINAKAKASAPQAIAILESFGRECEKCGATELQKAGRTLLQRAKAYDVVLLCSIGDITDVFRFPDVINAADKIMIDLLEQHRIEGVSFQEIKAILPESMTNKLLTERLDVLVEKGVIRFDENYYMSYPSFTDVLKTYKDERAVQTIALRIEGKTLEEIAQIQGGLTRERVRQIESNCMRQLFAECGQMDEDKYEYIYTTYHLNNELMESYLCFSKETVYFLEYKYKGTNKKQPVDERILDDPLIPDSLKKKIEKFIFSKKIRIGNEYVEAKRHLVEDALFPIFCKETISGIDFINQYNEFVTESQKPELLITQDLVRSRMNKYASSPKILWTLNQKMRYYDIEAIDKAAFLERLKLDRYHDVEISAKKILNDNRELMAEYDIRNGYELHNIFKKILTPSDCPGLELGRTPILQFGAVDRKQQVVDLMVQLAPISQDDFADAYSELYGVSRASVLANCLPYVKQYINKDRMLVTDVPALSDEQLVRLKSVLTNDYYSMDRLTAIIRSEYPGEPHEIINHYTLHQLGFNVFNGYVIRLNYRNATEYFTSILTAGDIADTGYFPQELINLPAYRSLIADLLSNYDLIEFMPRKYIRMSRLTELFGTTKEDIRAFCLMVKEFTDKTFFTVQSLKKDGFDDDLFELGFDDYFYSSILFFDREHFAHIRAGCNVLFKLGAQPFSLSDFIEWLLYREESMSIDAYELVELLNETYSIKFERYDIKQKILPGTSMYYSDITEKLYADYEIYFDEI